MNDDYFYKCPNCGTTQPYVLKRKKSFLLWIVLGVITFPIGIIFLIGAFSIPKEKYCPNCNYHIGTEGE